jgi:hypothetical protein
MALLISTVGLSSCGAAGAPRAANPAPAQSVDATAAAPATRLDKAALQHIGERAVTSLGGQGGEDGDPEFVGVKVEELGSNPDDRWVTFWYYPGVVPDGPSYVFVSAGYVEQTVPSLLADPSIASVQVVVLKSGGVPVGPEAAVTVRFDRAQMTAADWPGILAASEAKPAQSAFRLFGLSSAYSIARDSWQEVVSGGQAGWPSAKEFPQAK